MTKRLRRAAPRLSAASPFPPGTGRPVRTGHAYLTAFLSAALLLLALYAAPASASPEDNSLIVALERFPPGFNPAVASGSLTSQIGAQLFAGLIISMLPVLVVYVLFQRQVQEGLSAGALK